MIFGYVFDEDYFLDCCVVGFLYYYFVVDE